MKSNVQLNTVFSELPVSYDVRFQGGIRANSRKESWPYALLCFFSDLSVCDWVGLDEDGELELCYFS